MTVDTRTRLTPTWTPRVTVALIVLAAAAFVYVTAEIVPVGALAAIAADFRVSEALVGTLLASYALVAALERTGLTEKAVYVAKATMREQRIVRDVREVRSERGDCFAMVIVTRKERSGVLAGDVSPEAMLAKVEA